MRQVEDVLRQASSLDDTSDLDRPVVFDELPNGVEQIR